MPTKTNKKTPPFDLSEYDFLQKNLDRLFSANEQLDLRLYPTLGLSALFFLFGIYNVLNDGQKGLIGYTVIAFGSVIAGLLAGYSFKQLPSHSSYGHIFLDGLLAGDEHKMKARLRETVADHEKLMEISCWQVLALFKISEAKRKYQEAALHTLILTLMVGIILVIAMP
ncbi:hypothetical protein HY224_02005 [Candidatus Uhrbacteria bacterium]|nr:hypothetical protein [Candidatus Uhrbacteria bacterium]